MTASILTPDLDRDWRIRLAAFAALRFVTARTGGIVTREELSKGFAIPGVERRIPFADRGAGIWRPKIMPKDPGAALTVMTSLADPYGDGVSDDGWIEYAFQRGPTDNWYNKALINAFERQRPVIYLRALERGLFAAAFPVFVHSINITQRVASLAVESPTVSDMMLINHAGSPEILKRYVTTTAIQRLHQDKFRFAVLAAYKRECTVCTLGSMDRLVRLLDAAHILPDGDPRSRPEVPNGLSLCKIHHSAYDLNILGIDPDGLVHVRDDILAEVDGPMLQHGIKGMNGLEIRKPQRPEWLPNPEYLAERFEAFLAA